jgi:hypothetical protein
MYFFDRDLILSSGVSAEGDADLFLFGLPPRLELNTLSGVSDNFVSIQFGEAASLNGGSLIIGGGSPSGIIQILDLSVPGVVSILQEPVLASPHITKVTK